MSPRAQARALTHRRFGTGSHSARSPEILEIEKRHHQGYRFQGVLLNEDRLADLTTARGEPRTAAEGVNDQV